MSVNARTEKYQHFELFDKFALFTNARIDRSTVPDGWYCYDFRGSDDDPGELCYIERSVVVNYAGSVLMPEKLEFPASGRLNARDEFGFLDEGDMTLREFCEMHQILYSAEKEQFHIRPARPDEAGLFYAPSARAASRFVECFYTWETRTRTVDIESDDGTVTSMEEEYTVAVPVSLYQAYANLEAELGRAITEDDKSNINHIYSMIAGAAGGGNYNGEFLRGDGSSIDLDISTFTDPNSKNAADLVTYAIHAWESGWGYVWGTYGDVLTESLFAYKLEQYPDGVGSYEDFIRANWLGGRTADCVGLIKGYGWLSPETMTIDYGTHGMPDIGANQMYYSATESGSIDTMPDIPGLAVWHDGHIGVYIGGGQVIEAMGTKYGVVKTELAGRGWTHWLKIPYINYD